MFRRRPRRDRHRLTPEASLAEAEAARRREERKHEAEKRVTGKLDELVSGNHLAELFREACSAGAQVLLGEPNHRHRARVAPHFPRRARLGRLADSVAAVLADVAAEHRDTVVVDAGTEAELAAHVGERLLRRAERRRAWRGRGRERCGAARGRRSLRLRQLPPRRQRRSGTSQAFPLMPAGEDAQPLALVHSCPWSS